MQPDTTLEDSEIFNKLSHLEEQVKAMSQELVIDKGTIQKLQNLLTEKQTTIADLQATLSKAQQTLMEEASFSIGKLKQQLINSTDQKYIQPATQLMHREIDRIQKLIDETREFINAQLVSINKTISNTTTLISGLPSQTKTYFTQAYATVVESQINKLIVTLNSYIEQTKALGEQKIVSPVKNSIDKVITFSKEKTATLQFHVEDKLITSPRESISEFFSDLYFICKEFLKEIFYQIQKVLLGLINKILAMIKKIPFYQKLDDKIKAIRHPKEPEVFA